MPDSQLSTSAQQFVQAYESGQTDAAAKALGPLKVRRGRIRSQTSRWHHNRADERSVILESGISCKSWTVEPSWGRGRTRSGHSSYGHQFVTWIDCPGADSDSFGHLHIRRIHPRDGSFLLAQSPRCTCFREIPCLAEWVLP